MSTGPPRTPDRAALGESWVMASTASLRDSDPKTPPNNIGAAFTSEGTQDSPSEPASPSPRPGPVQTNQDKLPSQSTESLASSSWTIPGPELIMPSISEVSISEASWVAPNVPHTQTSQFMRKRRKLSLPKQPIPDDTQATDSDKGKASLSSSQKERPRRLAQILLSLYREHDKLLRTTLNALLIAIILHLLVLPEVVFQFHDSCRIPVIKSIYSDSCVQLPTRSPPHNFLYPSKSIISPEDTISSSQKYLESIFDHSLQTLVPLSQILKESENMISELQSQLHSTFPEARNALNLEFQGSDQALSAAIWEFESLRADLRSAVESLLSSPPTHDPSESLPSVARDTRIAAQLRRRAEYLDRLRAQIRSKADSLSTRFSTLDDHLEAVDGIVAREERRGSILASTPGGGVQAGAAGLNAMLNSISSYAGLWSRSAPDSSDTSSRSDASGQRPGNPRPVTTLALLRLAATHHRPIADSVASLSKQLRQVHGENPGFVW